MPKENQRKLPRVTPKGVPFLLSKPEVCERVGLSFVKIWDLMRAEKFPAARQIGGKTVWLESEIDAYILNLPTRRYKPLKPAKVA